jgi:hypothetical protein
VLSPYFSVIAISDFGELFVVKSTRYPSINETLLRRLMPYNHCYCFDSALLIALVEWPSRPVLTADDDDDSNKQHTFFPMVAVTSFSNLFLMFVTVALSSAQELTTTSPIFMNEDVVTSTNTISVIIQYEYRLELNQETYFEATSENKNDTRQSSINLQQVLNDEIDSNLLETLQSMLPYGGITAQNDGIDNTTALPKIRFLSATSDLYSACFTDSDVCGLVRATLHVEYDGPEPPHSVERAVYQLIQEYLDSITQKQGQRQIIISYLYPVWVECLIQFQLSPVTRRIDTNMEMNIMTKTFLEVVGATVAAMEGDTEIRDIQLLYQDLIEEKEEVMVANATNTIAATSLSADFIVLGVCRDCSDTDFAGLVHEVIPSYLDAYRSRLQQNGYQSNSSYFSKVDQVEFTVPRPLSDLEPIEDEALYDTQGPVITYSRVPIFVIFGMLFAVCILATGVFFVWKEIQEGYDYEKDDDAISTTSDSVLGADVEVSVERPDNNIAHSRPDFALQEYNIHEKEDPIGTLYRTSLNEYQVETVLSSEGNFVQDGQVQSYAYEREPAKQLPETQQRQWRESHQANYFGDNDWVQLPVRPPKGARRASATVSPATGMPFYTYAN